MGKKKVGCIGTGVMGSALMEAVIKVAGPAEVLVRDADPLKGEAFCRKNGCTLASTNRDIASGADFVFLAVKPQFLAPVLEDIAGALTPETVVVSMAAGVPVETIRKNLKGHLKIIRIMPNTPAAVGASMIAIAPDKAVLPAEVQELQRLLAQAGLTELTGEPLMDAVTAVSGSGPAYGYLFIEALADAAVQMGMPRAQAIRYSAQTLKGAAEMVLQTGTHPGALKDSVCSPAGTTIAAVTKLEEKGFRSAVIEAALAAWERSRELGK
ncbi:MAG TPA: pyrroline-5-carboxylate reductase [Treponemataceae bacterium]|nr:pyrroline-5-carboxylate reductase [Treponemataceae bacterium]HPS43778.1 pyrroline-5-carboxylate reductase [Treponemataceae bacterium]